MPKLLGIVKENSAIAFDSGSSGAGDLTLAQEDDSTQGLAAAVASGAAISRDDGRWWAIPLGAVIGSKIGCDAAGG